MTSADVRLSVGFSKWETNRATVEALTHAAVVYRPELLDEQGAGTFVEEVAGEVTRYLGILR